MEIDEKNNGFPVTKYFSMNINDDIIVRAVCMKMEGALVFFVYEGKPKLGSMVMKPFSVFPDPPLVLFEGKTVEASSAMATILSGLLKRGVFVSANIDPAKIPIQEVAKEISRFVIENIDNDK